MRKSLKESKEEEIFYLFLSFSGAHLDKILLKYSFQKRNPKKLFFKKETNQTQAPPRCHWIHAGEGYSVEQALNGTECGSNIVIGCGDW